MTNDEPVLTRIRRYRARAKELSAEAKARESSDPRFQEALVRAAATYEELAAMLESYDHEVEK
jgi:hypothetical protein